MPQRRRRALLTAFGVFVLGLPLVAVPVAAGAEVFDSYRVDGVTVDATAASAAEAREQALAQGQVKAFNALVRRLTLRRDHGRLPRRNSKQITNLVDGFEVTSERTSSVRYLAELSYRFKPVEIRKLLRAARIDFVDAPSRPMLVLPVYDGPSGLVLWDDPNPWRGAWSRLTRQGGLVRFVQALGDLSDFQLIDAVQAVEHDPEALSRIAQRYEAGHVLIVYSRLRRDLRAGRQAAEIEVSRFDLASGETRPVGAFRGAVGNDATAVLDQDAAAVANEIEGRWKQNNLVFSGPESRVVIGVPLTGFEEWLDIRRRLGAVRLVRSERLLRLTRRRADIEVVYLGSINRLAQAFAQNNLVLSRTARPTGGPPRLAAGGRPLPKWQLRLSGAESFEPAAQTDQ